MFTTNEYFDGKVKSLAFETADGKATLGVMAPGEYTFDTAAAETMTVVTGEMNVKLPGADAWQVYTAGQSYDIPANSAFDLVIGENASYLCRYA